MHVTMIVRFINADTYTGDPNDPLSLNLYTYCHNEPVMYSDPTGNFNIGIGRGIAIDIGVIINVILSSGSGTFFSSLYNGIIENLLCKELFCNIKLLGAVIMKKFRLSVLLMISIVILSSCSLGGGKMVISDDSDKGADATLEQILNTLSNNDKDSLKAMFSTKVINEAINFDDNLEYLFGFFQGKVVDWERTAFSAPTNIENGKKSIEFQSCYKVITDKEEYMFFVVEYTTDTFNPDNVGLYTLRVIKAADEETQFTTWKDMEVAGIYKPKE